MLHENVEKREGETRAPMRASAFDGDGDRPPAAVWSTNTGRRKSTPTRFGLMLAATLVGKKLQERDFVVDVGSPQASYKDGSDPSRKRCDGRIITKDRGHSYIKRRNQLELAPSQGFRKKSGHFFSRPPIRAWPNDCALTAAQGDPRNARIATPEKTIGRPPRRIRRRLLTSLTMSPHCGDEVKYDVVDKWLRITKAA